MGRLKIAFDGWVLAPRFNHHGTNVYARQLLGHLLAAAEEDSDIEFCFLGSAEYLRGVPPRAGNTFSCADTRFQSDRLWRLGGASRAARRQSADLIFSPSCNVVPSTRPPMVCTIHDVTPVVTPSHSQRTVLAQRFFLQSAARRSAGIITVSECSRRDIAEHCGVPSSKITVVYNGYDRELFNTSTVDRKAQSSLAQRVGIRRPYAIHHGVIQPRKNLIRLMEAHHLLLSRHRDLELDLVFAGPLGWGYAEILRAVQQAAHERGRVILTGALQGEELSLLVKGASLAVIPSLYEGFCLPMVEAMACGVPTVTSNNSCMPEISGDALLYFDPQSVEQIAGAMESILCNSELAQRVVARGLRRVREFSWERCARETLAVLRKAALYEAREHVGASA